MIILNPVSNTEVQRTLNNNSASLPSLQYDALMSDYQALKAQHLEQASQLTALQIALESRNNEMQSLQYEQQELQLKYELEVE